MVISSNVQKFLNKRVVWIKDLRNKEQGWQVDSFKPSLVTPNPLKGAFGLHK